MLRSLSSAALIASLVLLPSAALAKRHHSSDDSAPPPPPPVLAPMVTLTPGPGVSFQIPNNWIACEDDTEKQLASAPDAMSLRDKFCGRSQAVASVVRAFDPRPFHTLTVIFNYISKSPITETVMDAITSSDLSQVRGPMCDAVLKPLVRDPNSTVDCQISVGTLGGHHALVSTIVETNPADPNQTHEILSYELAYPGGYIQIQFATAKVLEAIVKPTRDAILASVHFDAAAPAPAATPAPDTASPEQHDTAPDNGTPPAPAPAKPDGTN